MCTERRNIDGMFPRLTVLGSSSRGNGYLLDCGKEQLIIECGVHFKECAKALEYNIGRVICVIVSHLHSDHYKYNKEYKQHGLMIHSTKDLLSKHRYRLMGFYVTPLKVPHGDCECYAYIIKLPAGQTCLFATDLSDFPYDVLGLNHIFIECNYSEEIRVNALLNGVDVRSSSCTHMELNTCISVINRLKSPELQSVTLLHLSDGLSDAEGFKRRIFEECGVHAEVAEKGSVFTLQKQDF